jgi:hypothetical protein
VIQNSHIGEVRDANGNLVFTRNTAYGIFAGESTFRRVAFLNSDFNNNGIDGIFFRNSRINSASNKSCRGEHHAPLRLHVAELLGRGNAQNGINFDGTTATNVSFDNVTFGDNALDGVFVHNNSNFTSLLIQDSHLGEVLDGDGNQILPGNGGAGFNASGSTFTGVAFLDSSFSANGSDGIRFATSMIKSGTVTLDPSTTLTTGFTLKSSQLSGNNNDGILLTAVTAADVTIQNTDIAENGGDGFAVIGSTVSGAAFLNSSSNANGVGGPGNGISFVDSTIERVS